MGERVIVGDVSDDVAVVGPGGAVSRGVSGFFGGVVGSRGGGVVGSAGARVNRSVETLLFGLEFNDMAIGAENFALTPRLQGESAILQVVVTMGSDAQAAILHVLGFALGRVVPADANAFEALEPIFPFANQLANNRFQLRLGANGMGLALTGRFVFAPRNRSIVVRFVNTSTATMDAWVGIVLEEPH